MIVAFMGNDGSGKTTLCMYVLKKLEKQGFQVKYRPGFDHIFLDSILNTWQEISGININLIRKEYLSKDNNKSNKFSLFKIWPYFVFFECLLTYILAFLERKKIIIFDRYFYDFLISYEYLGYSNFLVRKLFLSLPKPDVGFVLDVSPNVAYQRKKITHNVDFSYFKIQRKRYINMAKAMNFKVLNTENSIEELGGIVMNDLYEVKYFHTCLKKRREK